MLSAVYWPADEPDLSRDLLVLWGTHVLTPGRGFSITLGHFINRTAGAQLPTCSPAVCWLVHVETKWQSARAAGKQTWSEKSTADLGEAASACCCFSLLHLSRGNIKKLFVSSLMLKVRGLSFSPLSDFFFFFHSRLTAPFILYYSAWLLTPGELCSQIDALLLWGCSWNIKLYWNIHMWVHLAESNWCVTPQRPDGNVPGPQHAPADTLSSGQDSDCDLAEAKLKTTRLRRPNQPPWRQILLNTWCVTQKIIWQMKNYNKTSNTAFAYSHFLLFLNEIFYMYSTFD